MACIAYTWMPSRIPMVRCRRANYHSSFNNYLLSLQGTRYDADPVLSRPGLVALLCFFLSFLFLLAANNKCRGGSLSAPYGTGQSSVLLPPVGNRTRKLWLTDSACGVLPTSLCLVAPTCWPCTKTDTTQLSTSPA